MKPNEALTERLTKKWIDIGFQGADPSTDFRGSGILGLDQLLSVTREEAYKEKGLAMYQDSTDMEHWYFFSVTGINITQKLLNTLKDSKDQVHRINLEGPILDFFQASCQLRQDKEKFFEANMYKLMTHLYYNIFVLFNKEWLQAKPGIMQFNQFLDDIYGV